MLQQVLRDMYIDPELLAELDDEQKQILFCQMRTEQVRRWEEHEAKLEKNEKKIANTHKKNGSVSDKRVDFLIASDGSPWVWVMGEHKNDKSIEEIFEEETRQKAEEEAQRELEKLEKIESDKLNSQLEEEKVKIEKEKQEREEELRKQTEKVVLKSKKEELNQISEKKKQLEDLMRSKLREIKRNRDYQRRASITNLLETKERRCSQIFNTRIEVRDEILKLAEKEKAQLEQPWQEQERKAKQADTEKRAVARKAREEHRRSMSSQTEMQVISALMASYHHVKINDNTSQKPSVKPRASKPPNRVAVISWFQKEEEPKGAGLDPSTDQAFVWFHGIISRLEAEELLEDKKPGTFLVRVSEKVYGYAVSLRSPVRCKHFLIDVAENGYKFFGTNQVTHNTLASLVKFHQTKPISVVGQELLVHPCGQCHNPPDTAELFVNSVAQSSYL